MQREKLTSAILFHYISGHTIAQTVESTGATPSMVERVRANVPKEVKEQLKASQSNHISELIEESLSEMLQAQINILRVTNDEVWLKAQRAPELATFFGVTNDKSVRLLAAIQRANERGTEREEVSETGAVKQPLRAAA
jgi:hypothetical protein